MTAPGLPEGLDLDVRQDALAANPQNASRRPSAPLRGPRSTWPSGRIEVDASDSPCAIVRRLCNPLPTRGSARRDFR